MFATHPLTSTVASLIAFRSEAMAAVAWLALLRAHVRGRPLAAAIALLAAALCKETTLVLAPLSLVALAVSSDAGGVRAGVASERWRATLMAEVVAFALAIGARAAFAPGWRAMWPTLSYDAQILTRLASIGKAAVALVVPYDVRVCDTFPVVTWERWPQVGWAILGAGGLLLVAWLSRRRSAAGLMLTLALLPALQIVPVMRWWSPHYFYLPLVWVAVIAGQRLWAVRVHAVRVAVP